MSQKVSGKAYANIRELESYLRQQGYPLDLRILTLAVAAFGSQVDEDQMAEFAAGLEPSLKAAQEQRRQRVLEALEEDAWEEDKQGHVPVRQGGRPRDPANEWARGQVKNKGLKAADVYQGWLERKGQDNIRKLADPRDSFNKAIKS
jgi:hypothetical protein